MKTSLNIDDSVFQAAQKMALQQRKTVSEIISLWAKLGWERLKTTKSRIKKSVTPVSLGGPSRVNLNSRQVWLDELDT